MNNFAPQLKQQGYTNQFREDYEFSVKQAGVSNADLLGQAFTGLGEVAATGYKIAEQYEAEDKEAKRVAKAKADEEAKARTMQAYNEFGRQKMLINSRAEQTGNWNQADLETRRLLDQFSRREGVEYGKLLELSGKTDFTGAYGREKDTRTFYNNKKNEQDYKAWEAMTAANPSLRSVYSPEEGVSLINAVNDSYDGAEKYLSKLNTLDPSRDAAEYNRTERALKDEIGNNVVSALMVEIANNKDTLKLSSDVEKFRQDMRNKYTKAGVPGHILSIALDEGLNRSGVNDVIKSVNEYHTLYQKDIDMLVKTQVARGQEYLGATTEPYAAMWLQTDDWKSGRTFTESGRIANKYLNERMSSLAFRGELVNQTPLPSEARGEVYGGYSKIVNGNVGTPVLKGGVLQDVLTDATNFYGTQDAETRKQAYKEILSKFDNVYSDAAIAALKSDVNPLYRELGNTVERQMQTLRNAKDFAVFETSPTPAAESLRILKQGPGADLLRVTKDGELVMVDGSKGFLQSTAITLSDMTGRYFGAAADLNKYFGEIYKDAETRKQMLEAGGIPELDPMTEEVIGRKEWYIDPDKIEQFKSNVKEIGRDIKSIEIPTAPELIGKGKNIFTDIVKKISEDRKKTLATEQAADILNTPKELQKNKEEDLLNKIKTWIEKRKVTKQAAEILQDPQVSKRFEALEASVKYALKEKNLTAKEQAIEEVAKEADEWSKQIDDEISALGVPQTFGEMEQMKKIMKEKEEILKLYNTFIGTYGKSSAEDKIETETPQVFGEARLSRSEPLAFAHMDMPESYDGPLPESMRQELNALRAAEDAIPDSEQIVEEGNTAFEKTATNKADSIIEESGLSLDIMSDIVGIIESNNRADAVSNKGATGVMQLMPETYKDVAKRYGLPLDGIKDPIMNKKAGEIYLAELGNKFNNDEAKVLAAYNWGPTNLSKAIKKYGKDWRKHLPNETKNYLKKYYEILSKGNW